MFIPVIRIKGNAGYGLIECTVLVFLVFSYGVVNGLLMGGKTVRKHLEHCKDHQILFYKYTSYNCKSLSPAKLKFVYWWQ